VGASEENQTGSTTRLLFEWSNGNRAALSELTHHVYRELHTIARSYMRRQRRNATLQPTALINEVYVRLIDQSRPVSYASRAHFLGIAARMMRQILVDHARARNSAKRGGGVAVTLTDVPCLGPNRTPDILDLDAALTTLSQVDERKANVIELKYFGGLNRDEIAAEAGLTLPTVKRDLRLAEAWLRRYLTSADRETGRNQEPPH
jgi:RNA polymerase sigma factor (TIGR02999 family)